MGQAIVADEWVTDVYRRVEGQWRSALTHLKPVPARLGAPERGPSEAV